MGNKRRLPRNKQRGMKVRLRGGKKPMSAERKAELKKQREEQSARDKAKK